MKGIEKITARITQEAQAEIDRTLADAREQAAQITARYQAQADAEAASLAARNEKAAAEREERLVSVAQMEARKVALAAKQEMVEQVYRRALEKLRSMPRSSTQPFWPRCWSRRPPRERKRSSSLRRTRPRQARPPWPRPTSSCPRGS